MNPFEKFRLTAARKTVTVWGQAFEIRRLSALEESECYDKALTPEQMACKAAAFACGHYGLTADQIGSDYPAHMVSELFKHIQAYNREQDPN